MNHELQTEVLLPSAASSAKSEARRSLEQAQQGDRQAFGAWLNDAADVLRRRLLAWQCADHEIDDLSQETARAVWQSLPRWKSEFDPTGYGFAVFNAHRAMLQMRRKQRRRERLLPRTTMEGTERLPDTSGDPAEQISMQDRAERIWAAVSQLSPIQRQVITLYYREEMTLKQVGEVLGVTLERVRQALNQARRRLRELLADLQIAAEFS